jgi:hypothetical protein
LLPFVLATFLLSLATFFLHLYSHFFLTLLFRSFPLCFHCINFSFPIYLSFLSLFALILLLYGVTVAAATVITRQWAVKCVLVSITCSLAWRSSKKLIISTKDRIASHRSMKSSSARAPPSCRRNTWSVSFNKCFCFRPQHVSADVGPLHKKGHHRGEWTPTWPSRDWRPDAQILLGYATDATPNAGAICHHLSNHSGAEITDFRPFPKSPSVRQYSYMATAF